MIFADFYGPPSVFEGTRSALTERIAGVLRARPADVVLRRMATESQYTGAEIWIELSSEEQLARHGRDLAREVTAVVQAHEQQDVWVLFRIVPLSHVYLNGEPRRRGSATLD